MKGTKKQIKWAEDIKRSLINTCELNIKEFENHPYLAQDAEIWKEIKTRCETLISMVENHRPEADNAAWWIKNRNNLPNPVKVCADVRTMMSNGQTLSEALTNIFGF